MFQPVNATDRCGAILGKSHFSKKQLRVLDSLVIRGILTQLDVVEIVTTGESEKVHELFDQEKISESEKGNINELLNIFAGEPIGPEITIEFQRKNFPDRKLKVIAQALESDDGPKSMGLFDPTNKRPIARLNYSVFEENLHIVMISVHTLYQNFGYPEALMEQVLKSHPEIKTVSATLAETNNAALQIALKILPLEEAIKKTPAYKSAMSMGFTKVAVKELETRLNGPSRYSMQAEKP